MVVGNPWTAGGVDALSAMVSRQLADDEFGRVVDMLCWFETDGRHFVPRPS